MKKTKKEIIVAVSGGFDPIHIGHIRMFKKANEKIGKSEIGQIDISSRNGCKC
jgi:nicotinic acid mononucleotide adenylyltransferase